MIKLEKMHTLTIENSCNLDIHWIIEKSMVLCSAHVVLRVENKFVFYINNYINWDRFNQLYNLNLLEKSIWNANTVTYMLTSTLTKAISLRLEVAKEEI